MSDKITIGFVGMGKMGSAIARKLDGRFGIIWHDPNVEDAPGRKVRSPDEFSEAEIIVIAVKPKDFADAISYIDKFRKNKVFISIAAGVSSKVLSKFFFRWARVMPSIITEADEGIFAVFTPFEEIFKVCEKVFGHAGEVVRASDDREIDIFTAISASGPGYLSVIFEAFEDSAVKIGMSRETARRICAKTILGTAKLVEKLGVSPAEIKYRVMTPAGTTAEGVEVLTQAQKFVFEAVRKVFERCTSITEEIDRKFDI